MDGLKGVVPNSCSEVIQEIPVLFEETKTIKHRDEIQSIKPK
jgi:hypothetical protein